MASTATPAPGSARSRRPNSKTTANATEVTARIFTFAAFADEIDTSANNELLAGLTLATDCVRSGARPKYSAIAKQDLVEWARENKALCQACTDAHQHWSSGAGAELPEPLLARLLHARLQSVRQDFIDTQSSKIQAEGVDAAVPAASVKSGKEDKKQAAAASAASKKKDDAPASTSTAETSDPKNKQQQPQKSKLRDRIPGKSTDIRVQVVNDEPEDGPTFYFYLVDLVTPVILRDFLELGQGVDALFRVRDPNVESRASTRLLALKEAAMKQTSMDSLWNQVSWREITVTGAREGREVFDVLAKSCYAVLDEARAYDKFYHNSNLIRIPANANRDNTIRDYPGYAAMLDGYETDAVVSVEMIVDAMLDQVQKSPSSMAADAGNVTTTEASESDAVMGHLQAYFDRTIAHFSNADTTAEELLKSNANNRAAAFVVQHGDSAARKVGRYELSPLKIDQGLSTVGEMAQCSRVAKIQQSQAFKNLVANRAKDMLASKAQLYWVSKVPVPQLDRAVLQLEFERMLQQKYAGVQWSLDDYCWTEALTADTMAQVLQDAKVLLPQMHMQFFTHEGLLLVTLAADGDQHSLKAETVFAHQFTAKDTFSKFSSNMSGELALTSDSHQKSAYMYVLGNGLTSTEKHTTLFPSDGSQIRITREPKTTVNLLSDHSVLTMTTEGGKDAFIANLEDDAFLLSLERGKETDEFSVTIQTGEHLLTRVLKNGAISFEYPSSQRRKIKAALGDGSLLEVQRTVTKEAAIVKDYASSATEVNFPNGTTAYYSSAEGWLTTCFNGTRVPLDSTGAINKKVQVTPLRAVCDTDYNKNITTWTREDMVVYSANQSVPSECWARFADGSSITSTSKGVEVKHELYPTVLVGETEQTVFFDGGVSMIVTEASVEVKVPSGPALKVNFSGEGTFTTAQNVVFTFNFCEKTISTVDLAGNKFDVNANGESSAVAGKHNAATDTVICDTLPLREFIRAKKPANCSSHARGPRLFALKPDGSGMEILRESDLLPELVKLSEDPQTAMHESPVTFDDADASVTSTCVSVLTKRGRAKSIYSEQKTAVNSSETFVIERRLVRHPKLTAELRQQVLADWTRLQAIHAAKSATKHSYSVDSVTVEQAPDSVIAQKMQELQSADSYLARCMRELADERSRVRDIVINKPVETVSTATRPKAASVKNSLEPVTGASLESLNLPSQRELESTATDGAVPLYFDSEEGRAFLAANARKMKQLGAVAVVQAVGDGEAKAVVDAAAAMEAEAVESANGVSMTAPETDHLSQVVDAVEKKLSKIKEVTTPPTTADLPSAPLQKASRSLLELDVFGKPRKTKIQLPSTMRGQKPGLQPNVRNLMVEGPHKRPLKTSSLASKLATGGPLITSSFELNPGVVNFGQLREGSNYALSISMINVGVEPVRFKVKQPQASSGLKVAFTPGPVAPGMKTKLEFIIHAAEHKDLTPDADGKYHYAAEVELKSEWEILHIPVKAEILSMAEYDRLQMHSDPNKSLHRPHVRALASKLI